MIPHPDISDERGVEITTKKLFEIIHQAMTNGAVRERRIPTSQLAHILEQDAEALTLALIMR